MVELNKTDIKAVAHNRFVRRAKWWIIGGFIGWFGCSFGLIKLVEGSIIDSLGARIATFSVIIIIWAIGFVYWTKAENRAVKAFMGECEKESVLTFNKYG